MSTYAFSPYIKYKYTKAWPVDELIGWDCKMFPSTVLMLWPHLQIIQSNHWRCSRIAEASECVPSGTEICEICEICGLVYKAITAKIHILVLCKSCEDYMQIIHTCRAYINKSCASWKDAYMGVFISCECGCGCRFQALVARNWTMCFRVQVGCKIALLRLLPKPRC